MLLIARLINGILLGASVGLAVANPTPIGIGCAVVVGCMFVLMLAESR